MELVPDTTARAHLVSLGGVHALNIPIHRKHFPGGDVGEPVKCIVQKEQGSKQGRYTACAYYDQCSL